MFQKLVPTLKKKPKLDQNKWAKYLVKKIGDTVESDPFLPPIDKYQQLKEAAARIEKESMVKKAMSDAVEQYRRKHAKVVPPFLMMKTSGLKKLTTDEELDQELSFMTEDSEYEREQKNKILKRVKFHSLIEELIFQKDYILDYIDKNKRTLQITNYDCEVLK